MMKDRALCSLALIAALGAFGVAGCGGGDDTSTSPTTEALTAEEWATQADAICAQGDKDQQAAIRDFFQQEGIAPNQQPTGAQFQQLATEVILPNIEEQINAVEALPVPEDEAADQVQQFIDQAESDHNALKDDPNQIINESAFADTEAIAQDLGLKRCASG
jgi:hypothetical protein